MDGVWRQEHARKCARAPTKARWTASKSRSILASSTIGHIDLMVQEGFYSNRTDFIRTASATSSTATPTWSSSPRPERAWTSACGTTAGMISEAARRGGELLHIQVLGLASIAPDVTPELARATMLPVVCGRRCTPLGQRAGVCTQVQRSMAALADKVWRVTADAASGTLATETNWVPGADA